MNSYIFKHISITKHILENTEAFSAYGKKEIYVYLKNRNGNALASS